MHYISETYFFFLVIGLNNNYSSVVKINIDSLLSSRNAEIVEIVGCAGWHMQNGICRRPYVQDGMSWYQY